MANRAQEFLRRRQQELAHQAELAAAGQPADFVGPTTTAGFTPEQSAAAALAKARFYSQQLETFQPPRPEQTGISKFARNPIGMALMDMLPTGASNRNKEILSGEADRSQLENAFTQSVQGAKLAQDQMGVAQAQRQMSDEERNRKLDQIVTEHLGKLQGLSPEQFLQQAPGQLGEAGAATGRVPLIESAIGALGTAARSREELASNARQEAGRAYLDKLKGVIDQQPEQFENPDTLINGLTIHAFITGDAGELARSAEMLTGNKRYAEEHAMRTQQFAKELDSYDQKERDSILDDTLKLSTTFMPAGSDFNAAMGLALKVRGKKLEDLDPEFASSLKSLETPLVKMNELRTKIEAEKSLNGQWDRLNEEWGKTFEKDGKPAGWLKGIAENPGPPMADGSKLTMKEFVLDNFNKRITSLIQGGASGGGMEDQLKQITPGLLQLNETVQKQLEEERLKREADSKSKTEGAFRTIQSQTRPTSSPKVAGGSLRQ